MLRSEPVNSLFYRKLDRGEDCVCFADNVERINSLGKCLEVFLSERDDDVAVLVN